MKSLKAIWSETSAQLLSAYDKRESELIAFMILEDLFGHSRAQVLADEPVDLDEGQLSEVVSRLKEGEPVQQVLGTADFFSRKFTVNQHVLIPRPETEELVALIIEDYKGSMPHILDIGTGSGCIAISLALELNAKVFATDVSFEALGVAKENTTKLGATVEFIRHDILHDPLDVKSLDIVVSNPPYIPEKESERMGRNVVDYEPQEALFVPDADPLLFYRTIAEKAKGALLPHGKLYVEIHEGFGNQIKELFEQLGYATVTIIQDMQGKDRIIRAINSTNR